MTTRTEKGLATYYAISVHLLVQIIVAIIGWAVFIYLWYLTLAHKVIGFRPYLELAAIVLTAVAVVAVTQWWVWHNLQIWRRKGPRKQVTVADYDFSQDWLGRSVDADWQSLKNNDLITVTAEDGAKIYRSGRTQV